MKRLAILLVAAVLAHTLLVDLALVIKYEYWGTSASFMAGAVQRLIDWPVLAISRFVMNSHELPVWMPSDKASDAALIREIVVFDVIGGSLYGAVTFVLLSIHRLRRRSEAV
jgi:hypothetical protein